jgi:hypothetical protein
VRAVAALLIVGCGRFAFDPVGDGGTGGDGTPADGTLGDAADAPGIDAPFTCGPLAQVADDFNGAAHDPAKWSAFGDPGTAAGLAGGRVRLSLADNAATQRYAQFISKCTYDVRGRGVVVKLVTLPRAAPGAETAFCLTHPTPQPRQVCLDYTSNALLAVFNDGGNPMVLATRPFDAVENTYWRIFENGGTVFWQFSPTGTAWGTHFAMAAPTDMSAVVVELFGGTFQAVLGPGIAEYDDLSVQ